MKHEKWWLALGFVLAGLLLLTVIRSAQNGDRNVVSPEESKIDPELAAKNSVISSCKNDDTLGSRVGNDYTIRQEFKQLTGQAEFIGWDAVRISPDVWVASCRYSNKGKTFGYFFEDNITADTIRLINHDEGLIDSYNKIIGDTLLFNVKPAVQGESFSDQLDRDYERLKAEEEASNASRDRLAERDLKAKKVQSSRVDR